MNSLSSFCLAILIKYLRLTEPSSKSLIRVFVGSQDVQLEYFLEICCFAKILSLTVSTFKEFLILVLTQLTCENFCSTHADECSKEDYSYKQKSHTCNLNHWTRTTDTVSESATLLEVVNSNYFNVIGQLMSREKVFSSGDEIDTCMIRVLYDRCINLGSDLNVYFCI